MPKKILLFDIDGTLLLTGGAGRIAFERSVEELFGIKRAWQDIIPDGKTDPVIIEELLQTLPAPPSADQYRLLCERYHQHFEIEIKRITGFRLMPGISGLLPALTRQENVLMGIATGNFERAAQLKLRRGGLERYFCFGGYGSDSRSRPGLTRKAMERGLRLCREPVSLSDIYVIGDTVHDIRAGKAAGIRTIAVATGNTPAEVLSIENPDSLFTDLTSLEAFMEAVDLAPVPEDPLV